MRSYLTGLMVAPVAMLAFSSLVFAQAPAQKTPKPDPPIPQLDLSGIWSGPSGGPATLRADKVSPMTPEAKAKFEENTAEEKKGLPITKDPAFNCLPAGVPHTYQNGAFAFEIVQTPKRIFIFYESAHNWRQIWMDGRQIPKGGDPTWMGYSVGHWDGNDLVVESGNFNDRTWLDPGGHPHSDALHVTERYHRATYGTMQIQFIIDDPKSYTAPWTMKADFKLRPAWELSESFCVQEDSDNFQKTILGPNAK